MTKTNQHQTGVTLIEVLITVLILAIGSLGIASMQIAGIKYSSGAYGRSTATQLADDMANRLRNNRTEATNGAFGAGSSYEINSFVYEFIANKNCITDECSLTELAAYDKSSWLEEISRALPSGRGQITFDDETNANNVIQRIYSIAIQWRNSAVSSDQDGAVAADIQSVTYRVAL